MKHFHLEQDLLLTAEIMDHGSLRGNVIVIQVSQDCGLHLTGEHADCHGSHKVTWPGQRLDPQTSAPGSTLVMASCWSAAGLTRSSWADVAVERTEVNYDTLSRLYLYLCVLDCPGGTSHGILCCEFDSLNDASKF